MSYLSFHRNVPEDRNPLIVCLSYLFTLQTKQQFIDHNSIDHRHKSINSKNNKIEYVIK